MLLGGIPRLDASLEDAARRFVHLVDELYDSRVNLVCTADAPPTALYQGERLAAAFERTASRLIEMQSADYLAAGHLSSAIGAAATAPDRMQPAAPPQES